MDARTPTLGNTAEAQGSLMVLVARLADRDGVSNLAARPGLWQRVVDEHWTVYVNAHATEQRTDGDAPVSAHSCYVEFNGWPAGAFNAYEGWFAAGRLANEDAFLAAVEAVLG